jgi:hypothetical protein
LRLCRPRRRGDRLRYARSAPIFFRLRYRPMKAVIGPFADADFAIGLLSGLQRVARVR